MEASLHAKYGYTGERTCDEVPLVPYRSGVWEVWDLGVGDDRRLLEHLPESAETTTEDDSGTDILR